MRRTILTVAALLAFGSALLAALPAFAGYGAIAYDTKSGRRGWSWNQETPQRAAEVALSDCGASACKVLLRIGPRLCAALATTEDGRGWGVARRDSSDQARLKALAQCQNLKKGECVIRVTDCNK